MAILSWSRAGTYNVGQFWPFRRAQKPDAKKAEPEQMKIEEFFPPEPEKPLVYATVANKPASWLDKELPAITETEKDRLSDGATDDIVLGCAEKPDEFVDCDETAISEEERQLHDPVYVATTNGQMLYEPTIDIPGQWPQHNQSSETVEQEYKPPFTVAGFLGHFANKLAQKQLLEIPLGYFPNVLRSNESVAADGTIVVHDILVATEARKATRVSEEVIKVRKMTNQTTGQGDDATTETVFTSAVETTTFTVTQRKITPPAAARTTKSDSPTSVVSPNWREVSGATSEFSEFKTYGPSSLQASSNNLVEALSSIGLSATVPVFAAPVFAVPDSVIEPASKESAEEAVSDTENTPGELVALTVRQGRRKRAAVKNKKNKRQSFADFSNQDMTAVSRETSPEEEEFVDVVEELPDSSDAPAVETPSALRDNEISPKTKKVGLNLVPAQRAPTQSFSFSGFTFAQETVAAVPELAISEPEEEAFEEVEADEEIVEVENDEDEWGDDDVEVVSLWQENVETDKRENLRHEAEWSAALAAEAERKASAGSGESSQKLVTPKQAQSVNEPGANLFNFNFEEDGDGSSAENGPDSGQSSRIVSDTGTVIVNASGKAAECSGNLFEVEGIDDIAAHDSAPKAFWETSSPVVFEDIFTSPPSSPQKDGSGARPSTSQSNNDLESVFSSFNEDFAATQPSTPRRKSTDSMPKGYRSPTCENDPDDSSAEDGQNSGKRSGVASDTGTVIGSLPGIIFEELSDCESSVTSQPFNFEPIYIPRTRPQPVREQPNIFADSAPSAPSQNSNTQSTRNTQNPVEAQDTVKAQNTVRSPKTSSQTKGPKLWYKPNAFNTPIASAEANRGTSDNMPMIFIPYPPESSDDEEEDGRGRTRTANNLRLRFHVPNPPESSDDEEEVDPGRSRTTGIPRSRFYIPNPPESSDEEEQVGRDRSHTTGTPGSRFYIPDPPESSDEDSESGSEDYSDDSVDDSEEESDEEPDVRNQGTRVPYPPESSDESEDGRPEPSVLDMVTEEQRKKYDPVLADYLRRNRMPYWAAEELSHVSLQSDEQIDFLVEHLKQINQQEVLNRDNFVKNHRCAKGRPCDSDLVITSCSDCDDVTVIWPPPLSSWIWTFWLNVYNGNLPVAHPYKYTKGPGLLCTFCKSCHKGVHRWPPKRGSPRYEEIMQRCLGRLPKSQYEYYGSEEYYKKYKLPLLGRLGMGYYPTGMDDDIPDIPFTAVWIKWLPRDDYTEIGPPRYEWVPSRELAGIHVEHSMQRHLSDALIAEIDRHRKMFEQDIQSPVVQELPQNEGNMFVKDMLEYFDRTKEPPILQQQLIPGIPHPDLTLPRGETLLPHPVRWEGGVTSAYRNELPKAYRTLTYWNWYSGRLLDPFTLPQHGSASFRRAYKYMLERQQFWPGYIPGHWQNVFPPHIVAPERHSDEELNHYPYLVEMASAYYVPPLVRYFSDWYKRRTWKDEMRGWVKREKWEQNTEYWLANPEKLRKELIQQVVADMNDAGLFGKGIMRPNFVIKQSDGTTIEYWDSDHRNNEFVTSFPAFVFGSRSEWRDKARKSDVLPGGRYLTEEPADALCVRVMSYFQRKHIRGKELAMIEWHRVGGPNEPFLTDELIKHVELHLAQISGTPKHSHIRRLENERRREQQRERRLQANETSAETNARHEIERAAGRRREREAEEAEAARARAAVVEAEARAAAERAERRRQHAAQAEAERAERGRQRANRRRGSLWSRFKGHLSERAESELIYGRRRMPSPFISPEALRLLRENQAANAARERVARDAGRERREREASRERRERRERRNRRTRLERRERESSLESTDTEERRDRRDRRERRNRRDRR